MKKEKLPKIVKALFDPKIYPHPVKKIELVQTQMSWVFLTGNFVYKIKKPVNFGFLDYTTLEKRKLMSEREVNLNKRLAPEIYLGIVAICQQGGKIKLGEKGKILEYAVKMKQLPDEKMFSVLLRENKISKKAIEKIAKTIANFHQKAETSPEINQYGELDIIRTNTEENFSQTEKYIGRTLSQEDFEQIRNYTRNFLENNISLFEKRIQEGKIRDCHGDLQAGHIYLEGEKIYIIDCIEFNERFRYGDVASEIAFLAMDLDFLGFPNFSNYLVKSYIGFAADPELLRLLDFYKCYRAYVRGKIESFKLDDPHISTKEKRRILKIAKKYFKLALSYSRPSKLKLIICFGLPFTGKSTIAKALAKRLEVKVFSSDVIRKKLANVPFYEHRFKKFREGIYVEDFSRKTYDKMLLLAEKSLKKGQSVILDATFWQREERQRARNLAEKFGAFFLAIECLLDEKTVKKRVEKRAKEKTISDANWQVYLALKKIFEPAKETPKENHIIVDGSKPPVDLIQAILERLY